MPNAQEMIEQHKRETCYDDEDSSSTANTRGHMNATAKRLYISFLLCGDDELKQAAMELWTQLEYNSERIENEIQDANLTIEHKNKCLY